MAMLGTVVSDYEHVYAGRSTSCDAFNRLLRMVGISVTGNFRVQWEDVEGGCRGWVVVELWQVPAATIVQRQCFARRDNRVHLCCVSREKI